MAEVFGSRRLKFPHDKLGECHAKCGGSGTVQKDSSSQDLEVACRRRRDDVSPGVSSPCLPLTSFTMPRLLPRLIEKLKVAPITARKPRPLDKGGYTPRKTTSAHRPVLDEPSFDARGRTQSILLDHMSPVTHRHLYLRRKTHPPRVHASEPTNGQANPLREMTTHEREWWSSPYCTCHT